MGKARVLYAPEDDQNLLFALGWPRCVVLFRNGQVGWLAGTQLASQQIRARVDGDNDDNDDDVVLYT